MISTKTKKNLIIISPFVFIVIFLSVIFYISLEKPWPQNPDAKRVANIQTIRREMEMYYGENNSRYLQTTTIPSIIKEFTLPLDPKGYPYGWIDNTNEPQKFCIYTKLETKDIYFIASHCGAKEVNRQPVSLDNCCELSSP